MNESVEVKPYPPMWVRKIIAFAFVFGTPILLLFAITRPEDRLDVFKTLLIGCAVFIGIFVAVTIMMLLTEWAGFNK